MSSWEAKGPVSIHIKSYYPKKFTNTELAESWGGAEPPNSIGVLAGKPSAPGQFKKG